jgi:hypothetical protein
MNEIRTYHIDSNGRRVDAPAPKTEQQIKDELAQKSSGTEVFIGSTRDLSDKQLPTQPSNVVPK